MSHNGRKADTHGPGFREEAPVLLVATPWQSRAYILAELQERGYEVRALPGIRHAIGYLVRCPHVHPALVILDSLDDPDLTPQAVEDLRALTGRVPWVIVLSALQRGALTSLVERPHVHLLVRPVRVGDIISLVTRLVERENLAEQGG